jgi:hypothetical protein
MVAMLVPDAQQGDLNSETKVGDGIGARSFWASRPESAEVPAGFESKKKAAGMAALI